LERPEPDDGVEPIVALETQRTAWGPEAKALTFDGLTGRLEVRCLIAKARGCATYWISLDSIMTYSMGLYCYA